MSHAYTLASSNFLLNRNFVPLHALARFGFQLSLSLSLSLSLTSFTKRNAKKKKRASPLCLALLQVAKMSKGAACLLPFSSSCPSCSSAGQPVSQRRSCHGGTRKHVCGLVQFLIGHHLFRDKMFPLQPTYAMCSLHKRFCCSASTR